MILHDMEMYLSIILYFVSFLFATYSIFYWSFRWMKISGFQVIHIVFFLFSLWTYLVTVSQTWKFTSAIFSTGYTTFMLITKKIVLGGETSCKFLFIVLQGRLNYNFSKCPLGCIWLSAFYSEQHMKVCNHEVVL